MATKTAGAKRTTRKRRNERILNEVPHIFVQH